MENETAGPAIKKGRNYTDGAVGAGLVLIVLPCVALYYGTDKMGANPAVGLPILAIFGIMILFGALAIIATLFSRLDLSDSTQALALPEGSIRAAIALALIVLFAIIAIMLYQSVSKPYVIMGLGEREKSDFVKSQADRVIAVVLERCTTSPTGAGTANTASPAEGGAAGAAASKAGDALEKCASDNLRFSVHVRQPPAQESTDLAKQLLILIGTLMTSVTSFYFASRAAESKRKDDSPEAPVDNRSKPPKDSESPALATGHTGNESHMDGCDVPIVDATSDEDLPVSKGGVA